MLVDPPAHHRAVLEQEEERQKRERQAEGKARERLDPVDRAADQSVPRIAGTSAVVWLVADDAPEESTPESSSQPWTFAAASFAVAPISPVCETIPPRTRTSYEERDREEREQHDHRAEGARNPMVLQLGDDRRRRPRRR